MWDEEQRPEQVPGMSASVLNVLSNIPAQFLEALYGLLRSDFQPPSQEQFGQWMGNPQQYQPEIENAVWNNVSRYESMPVSGGIVKKFPQKPIDAGYIRDKIDEVVAGKLSREEAIVKANKSARAAGAVGSKAITPSYVNHTSRAGEKILDYGSGKSPIHTESLRKWGMDVTPYDFGSNIVEGIHDTAALSRKYDTVMASNVINTQSSEGMLRATLAEIKSSVAQNGRAVFNYPVSPRYADLTTEQVEKIVMEYFPNLKRVGGTKWAPLWEARE